jgi:serine/threonine-protein kinase
MPHAAGLVHRDVTPSNVLITKKGHAYLIDFGISRTVVGSTHTITAEGDLVGSIPYIAPERFNGAKDDLRVDVYSLACVTFEALTSEKAFPNGNRERRRPPRPSGVNPDVPEAFNGVIGRGLATEPQSRYDSAGDLASAARKALEIARKPAEPPPRARTTYAAPAPAPTKVEPNPGPPPRPRPRPPLRTGTRWSRWVGWTLAVAAATLGGWAYFATDNGAPAIQIGNSPSAISSDPDGRIVYVVNSASDTVSVVDLDTRAVAATIPVGDEPLAIAVDADGTRGYVANRGSDSVSVIDLDTRTVLATTPVGDDPTAITLTPDGTRAYVCNSESGDISVIDTSTDAVTATIFVTGLPWSWLSDAAISPDGTRILVSITSKLTDDGVKVVDATSGRVVADIRTGEAPQGVVISEDGRRAYVANSGSDTVSVIDVANEAVTTNVPVGSVPLNVALSPDGRIAYVTNSSDGTVSKIDTGSNLPAPATPVGDSPIDMTISPDGRRAFLVSPESSTLSVVELG